MGGAIKRTFQGRILIGCLLYIIFKVFIQHCHFRLHRLGHNKMFFKVSGLDLEALLLFSYTAMSSPTSSDCSISSNFLIQLFKYMFNL